MHAILQNETMRIIGIIIVITAIIFLGREVMTRIVIYVFPDDFCGFLNVVESPDGVVLVPSLRGLVIEVPTSGRVEVKSIDLLRKWSYTKAKYVSGKSLKVFVRKPKYYKESEFGYWMMGVPAGERLYAFVGTRKEMETFVARFGSRIYQAPPLDP